RPTDPGTLHDASSREILPGVFKLADFTKYLVLCTVEGQPVVNLDMFDVHRSIVTFVGENQKYPPSKMWRSPPPRRVLDFVPCLRYLVLQSSVLHMPPLTSVEGQYSLKRCSNTQRRSFWRSSKTKRICTRDKVSVAEARNTALKYISSHGDTYAQVVSRHKAQRTVAATPPRESSVHVLNSAPTPNSMPPILSPSLVAEVHEAGTSVTPHLSSTSS
ncbi:hypothetical protein Hamer_G015545, partial [Homarus americanus]